MRLLFALGVTARTAAGLSKFVVFDEGLGTEVGTVCDGGEMYIELDYDVFAGLAAPVSGTYAMPDDDDCAPFDHVYFSFEPVGHPPWDGLGNGYGQPHVDIHFYIVSQEYRLEHMHTCELIPGAANCDGNLPQDHVSHDENAHFFIEPPPTFTTGFFSSEAFGGNAVPDHGNHYVPDSDGVDGGPASCVSAGDGDPGWLDCLNQQLGVLGVTEDPPAFVDLGCACGAWTDGVSPILLTFDGHVVGYEIMPSLSHGARLGVDLQNPYIAPYPQQERKEGAVEATGHHPTHIRSFRDTRKIQFGLTLASDAPPATEREVYYYNSESDGAAAAATVAALTSAAAAASAAAALL